MPLRQREKMFRKVCARARGCGDWISEDVLHVARAARARMAHIGELQGCRAQREDFKLGPAAVAVEVDQQMQSPLSDLLCSCRP